MEERSLDAKPVLRWPLDIQHVELEGIACTVLRDQDGLAPDVVVVPTVLLPVISRFDGDHTLREILEEGADFGVTEELLFSLVEELDQLSFLDTEETRALIDDLKKRYRDESIREAVLAGKIYPEDAQALRGQLREYVAQSQIQDVVLRSGCEIAALISPHIDYPRGGQVYGASFAALAEVERPDLIVIFGTSHRPGTSYFHLTKKDFITPIARIPAAKQFIEDLGQRYGEGRCFGDELLHRDEHSIELQLPFIAHRFVDEEMPAIVPVLVGSFHSHLSSGLLPKEDPEVGEFISALGELVSEVQHKGRKVLLYGGVDLAHVGQHFGDPQRMTEDGLKEVENQDREFLDYACAGDADRFFEYMAADGDRRRVCGYPAIYTMLALMEELGWEVHGTCLDYFQSVEKESDCIVTVASAYWERKII